MSLDKNKNEIKVGDIVTGKFVVTHVGAGEDGYNLSLMTIDDVSPNTKATFSTNSKLVELASAASAAPAAPASPPETAAPEAAAPEAAAPVEPDSSDEPEQTHRHGRRR